MAAYGGCLRGVLSHNVVSGIVLSSRLPPLFANKLAVSPQKELQSRECLPGSKSSIVPSGVYSLFCVVYWSGGSILRSHRRRGSGTCAGGSIAVASK